MEAKFLKLYPNIYKQDRRQHPVPVEFERRSGTDRRSNIRLSPQNEETFKSFISVHQIKEDHFTLSDNEKTFLSALSPIVPIRRLSSVPDNIKDGNYEKAAGLVALAVINFPEDGSDLKASFQQLSGKYEPYYDYTKYQHTFSFFKGTLLERLLRLPGKSGKYISEKLQRADDTLYSTKFGKTFRKIFNIETADIPFNTGKTYGNNKKILAHSFKGNFFKQTVGRALVRIPVISVFVLSFLELPAIIKSFKNNENNKISAGLKQIAKSIGYIISIFSAIGLAGAALAKKGPTGSLIGMGIGAVIGSNLSKTINKQIDKI